jgi:hypothetical protein
MKKDDAKKDFIDRIKDGKPKEFEIKKIELSEKIGGVDPDYVIRQAEKFLNTPADPNFGYKGRKTHTVIKYVESPGKFFGIKIGRFRIGVFTEYER